MALEGDRIEASERTCLIDASERSCFINLSGIRIRRSCFHTIRRSKKKILRLVTNIINNDEIK